MGQVWALSILGGYMYSDQLSNTLRMDLLPTVKFRQFCDARDATEKGLNTGDLYHWNVYSRVATGGGQLNEQVEIPKTNFTITQGTLSITEYGNAVDYTGKLNDMSKHPVTEIIHKVLKVDAKETLDGAAHAQFNRTLVRISSTAALAGAIVVVETGIPVTVNDTPLTNIHVKAIVDLMKERNVPPYTGDDYYALGWPSTFRTFKNNLEAIKFYVETGFKLIMNGEVGRYEGMRFCEQTAIAKGGAYDSLTWTFRTPDHWDHANSSDWVFFFGEDTVAEAMAIPEEIRGKIPGDYGRSRGIAWYYLGGFGLVQGTSSTNVANTRIFKWDSAS